MKKSYKFRIYPNRKQQRLIDKTFGCCRFIYNYFLDERIRLYETEEKSISGNSLSRELPKLKRKYTWLSEVPSPALQEAISDLDNAYENFFRRVKRGQKPGFPKFKSKKSSKQSYREYYSEIDFEASTVRLLKTGKVKIRGLRRLEGKISRVTVSKTSTDRYYASVLVEDGKEFPTKSKIISETTIGMDVGLKSFITLSDGRKLNLLKQKRDYRRLEILQRRVSKKQKESKNRIKANLKVAKQYEKITNVRSDFLHKLSHQLTHENQVRTIVVENLNVVGMMQNRHLSKAISRSNWSEFINQLRYKSDWYGLNFIQIDRFEPTSKTCSNCGTINKNLTLDDRVWTCNVCYTKLDRDINAAINIKNTGLGRPSELAEVSGFNTESVKQESRR